MSGPRDKARARRALYTTVISAVPPALGLLAGPPRFFSGISGQVTWNVLANRMTLDGMFFCGVFSLAVALPRGR